MKQLIVLIFLSFGFLPAFAQQKNAPAQPTDTTNYKIFEFVEVSPEFPGGQEAMMKFLAENIKYPATALQASIEGLVVAQFIIDKTGKISDVNIIKPLGGGTDEEAIRVLTAMPKWQPGKQNGKEVSVRYTLPIRFSFGSKKKKKNKQ